MAEPLALAALVVDAAIGWPEPVYRRLGHPVGFFAAIIWVCERRLNSPGFGNGARRVGGIFTVAVLLLVAIGGGISIEILLVRCLGGWSWVGLAVFAFPGLAQRSLFEHVRDVVRPLTSGNLPAARNAVGMIVGRDTAALDKAGVARATIESLAESFSDGVTAPLFWLIVLGLPGIWAYKAINTADSLIGHREEPFRAFGWAAARSDDLLNLIPARISGLLLCLAGAGGWRILWRDAGKHASPNAGWPEAAMAGALGLRLAGPIAYDGVVLNKAWIGDGKIEAAAKHVRRALGIYISACLGLWLIAGACAWLR